MRRDGGVEDSIASHCFRSTAGVRKPPRNREDSADILPRCELNLSMRRKSNIF